MAKRGRGATTTSKVTSMDGEVAETNGEWDVLDIRVGGTYMGIFHKQMVKLGRAEHMAALLCFREDIQMLIVVKPVRFNP